MATTGSGKRQGKSTKRTATRATGGNLKGAKRGSASVTVSSRAGDKRAMMNTGTDKRFVRGTTISTVPEIMRQIDSLPDADRVLLESQLAERSEAEWLREARAAQELARARGIDQAAIDRAVGEVRTPRPRNGRRG